MFRRCQRRGYYDAHIDIIDLIRTPAVAPRVLDHPVVQPRAPPPRNKRGGRAAVRRGSRPFGAVTHHEHGMVQLVAARLVRQHPARVVLECILSKPNRVMIMSLSYDRLQPHFHIIFSPTMS